MGAPTTPTENNIETLKLNELFVIKFLECRYFMDNALKPNETHVPAIKLNEVNAFKQIGGLLKYVTQEKEKKIHVFRSCAVDASLFWEWSTGEWALLDKKDFAVESVGNSNYMVLRVSVCFELIFVL